MSSNDFRRALQAMDKAQQPLPRELLRKRMEEARLADEIYCRRDVSAQPARTHVVRDHRTNVGLPMFTYTGDQEASSTRLAVADEIGYWQRRW